MVQRGSKKFSRRKDTYSESSNETTESKTILVFSSMARDNNGLSTSNQLEQQQNHDEMKNQK